VYQAGMKNEKGMKKFKVGVKKYDQFSFSLMIDALILILSD
jgi:hypothetical protein